MNKILLLIFIGFFRFYYAYLAAVTYVVEKDERESDKNHYRGIILSWIFWLVLFLVKG